MIHCLKTNSDLTQYNFNTFLCTLQVCIPTYNSYESYDILYFIIFLSDFLISFKCKLCEFSSRVPGHYSFSHKLIYQYNNNINILVYKIWMFTECTTTNVVPT